MCIVILIYISYINSCKFRNRATEDTIFNRLIWSTVAFCVADFYAWHGDGRSFLGAYNMVLLGNIFYITFYPAMAFLWVDYTLCKVKGTRIMNYKVGKLFAVVIAVLGALNISTPFTNFLFTIDAENCYHRGLGAIINPLVAWGAIISVTLTIYLSAKKSKRLVDKEAIEMVIFFLIPTFVTMLVQIIFFGVSVFQVGFTLSLLIVFVNRQKNMISHDELTGLNNRHELNRYYDKLIQGGDGVQRVCIYVIDINKFKSINDKYGHMEGDNALKILAMVLKVSVNRNPDSTWFLARFGGDEFVLVGTNKGEYEINEVKEFINAELDRVNSTGERPYSISVSFGYVEGRFGDADTVETLMERADASMYKDKESTK